MSAPNPFVVLIGEGKLYSALAHNLQIEIEIETIELPGMELDALLNTKQERLQGRIVVSAYDWWDPVRDLLLQRSLRPLCYAWLPIWVDFSTLWAGPWIFAHEPGCLICVEERRHRLEGHPELQAASVAMTRQRSLHCLPFSIIPYVRAVSALLAKDIHGQQYGEAYLALRGHILLWNFFTQESEYHAFSPIPDCMECNILPLDQPELAQLFLVPRSMAHPGSWRIVGAATDIEAIARKTVSPRIGIIQSTFTQSELLMRATARASVPGTKSFHRESGIGRATVAEQARRIAILEILERYAGFLPGGKRPALHATYRELNKQACDPRSLILFSPEQYELPGFRYTPFDEDETYLWVWAYSFREQRPLAIPEEFAYYGPLRARQRGDQDRLLVHDLSNGCALGNCLEEAILHALFEVLERDAFLLTWYARLEPTCLDLETVQDKRILFLKDRLFEQGYDIRVFNITQEFGVPTVWAMAISLDDDPMHLKSLSAAGCHIDPERAISAALIEVAAYLDAAQQSYLTEREQALTMLEDNNRVQAMHDHLLFYALPEAFGYLCFLFAHEHQPVPLNVAFPGYQRVREATDLTQELQKLIERILASGLDVLIFDQTTQEQERLGLKTVRALVPGALPMTFGQANRRYENAERLWRALAPLEESGTTELARLVNPLPHPFP